MSTVRPDPVRMRSDATGWLWLLVRATVVVASVELVVLRLFTRTVIHIPGAQSVSQALALVSLTGRFSYYLASVLLTATLLMLLVVVPSSHHRGAGAAAAVFVATAALARAGLVGDLPLSLLVCASVGLLAAVAVRACTGRARLPVASFAAGFLVAGAYAALQSATLAATARPPAGASMLLFAAEALALCGAVTSPLLLERAPDRRSIVVGLGVGAGATVVLLANASTVKILLLWNFGLAGYFPTLVYGVAAGAVATTLTGLARQGRTDRALSIALLVVGGVGLHSTYQSALVITGLATLVVAHLDLRLFRDAGRRVRVSWNDGALAEQVEGGPDELQGGRGAVLRVRGL